jgi:nucleoside-diphosphate-sugar epimerase
VGDVAAAVLAALDHPAAAAGHEAELVMVPEPLVPDDLEATKSMAQHFLVDSRKAMTVLGWRPTDPA